VYHLLFVDDLLEVLEQVPLHQRQHMWFMLGGAPPDFFRIVRQHVNQISGEQCIGLGGPIN
jgi:hypothetical protein